MNQQDDSACLSGDRDRMRKTRPLVAFLLLLLTSSPLFASNDWPEWRGPDRDGVSRETGWLSIGRAEPLWSRNLGLGYSCFSVANGRVFTMGFDEEQGRDSVYCLDAETGRVIWRHSYPAEIWANFHGGGSLTTPAIDGEVVYTSNRDGKLFCFRVSSGEIIWEKDLNDEFGPIEMYHGYAGSPIVIDDQLIVSQGGRTVAFAKRSGELLWQTKNYGEGSYATPIDLMVGGRPCLAAFTGTGLVMLDRRSGEELAMHEWRSEMGVNCATPVVVDENRLFISSAYQMGCAMLKFGGDDLEVLWQNKRMRSKMTGCVLWDGHLYGFDESMLKCLDLDGNERWRVRGLGMGSLMISDGRLIVQSSRGELIIAEATPDEYRELSRVEILDGGVSWTSPVLAGGRIYCRNSLGDVVCLDHRAGEGVKTLARAETPAEAPLVTLPAAKELFARHLEAIGGEQMLRKHSSMQLTGTSVNLADGETGSSLSLLYAAPDRFLEKRDLGIYGAILSGYDGAIGWSVNPWEGNSVAEGATLDELRHRADYFADAEWSRLYESMRTTGIKEFDGRRCYVVEATKAGGADRSLYFEVESGLLAGREGSEEALVMLADYKAYDGLMIPTTQTTLHPETGGEQVQTIASVTFDTVESTAFEPPEPIRWLLMGPEEVEAANAKVRERMGEFLGEYETSEAPPPMNLMTVTVAEGKLALLSVMGTWVMTGGPDDYVLRDMPAFTVTFNRDEQGRIVSVTMDGGPEGPTVMKKK